MATDAEIFLKSKIDIYRELLRLSYTELNVYRHFANVLFQQNPSLDTERILDICRRNQSLREDTEKRFAHLDGVLGRLDSTALDEALADFQRWTPPKEPPD